MATNEVGSQMKNEESPGNAAAGADLDLEAGQSDKRAEEGDSTGGTPNPALVAVVVSNPGPEKLLNAVNSGKEELELPDVASPKKGCLPRTSSSHEQCRVCQQEKEEVLIDLGCQCRGGLAKAHRSCIDTWFRTKGSNQCEICQSVAANVPPPESQSTTNYWVWRVDPNFRRQDHGRACFSPLWVAFSILIGGLLLDVLISVTLGVSALPVNIIIGVIVVLGLGTALRLSLEFCHEWSLRRVVQRVETNVHIAYHPGL
ncbi:E3 ubiquitin-protein ligase MARCH2 isoform X2 [Carica papaya]|uniref:E3 ubiquitin-protein ligase MARCH2 isoform X2 n=1 Tax=Carica papaya TaxID=3649 RepID=UPI000B8C7FF5|nr:E3 ubiquitin-protein ligase MARCH2 isoform X2 [Carica papaya]